MKRLPFRAWIGVLIFFTTFTNYMVRVNMSVSIIEMSRPVNKTIIPYCTKTEVKKAKEGTEGFNWDQSQQANILSAYFYGYMAGMVPAGIVSELLGPWHVIMWGSVISAVLTALTPISATTAQGSHWGVVAIRVLIGFVGGFIYPASMVLIAKWAPPTEKGKFLIAMMGNTIGTVFSFTTVGAISQEYGWELAFYVLAIVMAVFCIVFFFFAADEPGKSRWTSQEERDYIFECQEGNLSRKKKIPPYLKIAKSLPVWMLVLVHFGSNYNLNVTVLHSPLYLANTIGFNLRDSAITAALPYLARMLGSAIFGNVADWIRKTEKMSVTNIRKLFIIFSHFMPACCFFLMAAADCNKIGAVALLILNHLFNSAVVASSLINAQDLSPNFAGTVFSLVNVLATTSGVMVPSVTAALDKAFDRHIKGGLFAYMIGGIICCFTGFMFILFGSGNVQPWNQISEEEQVEKL